MKATLQTLLGLEALGIHPDTGLIMNTLSPTPLVPTGPSAAAPWRKRLRNARAGARQVMAAALLAAALLPSPAAAVEPEKQPIYVNIMNNSLCGTDPISFLEQPVPCQVPAGFRLIIEHVSGFAFLPTPANSMVGVSIAIKDPKLGLGGTGELAFHTFVATKTNTSGGTDVLTFSSPFKMMLHGGATFYLSPADNAHVSGYLVKE